MFVAGIGKNKRDKSEGKGKMNITNKPKANRMPSKNDLQRPCSDVPLMYRVRFKGLDSATEDDTSHDTWEGGKHHHNQHHHGET